MLLYCLEHWSLWWCKCSSLVRPVQQETAMVFPEDRFLCYCGVHWGVGFILCGYSGVFISLIRELPSQRAFQASNR